MLSLSSASLHLPDLREGLPWLTDCKDPRQSVCWSEPQREGRWTQVVINLPSAGTPGQLWKEMCKSRKRTLPWPTRIGGQLYCLHPTPVNLMAPYDHTSYLHADYACNLICHRWEEPRRYTSASVRWLQKKGTSAQERTRAAVSSSQLLSQ